MLETGIPSHLKAFAEREFVGERLIWATRPDVRTLFWLSFGIWLFAVPWTAFAVFWESMVAGPLILELLGYEVSGKEPGQAIRWGMVAMGLFGLPFIFVGLGMLSAPYWVLSKGAQTLFVLTDRRLCTLSGRKTIEIISIWPNDILSTSRKEGPDGRGTLIVHQGYTRDSDGDRVEKRSEFGVIDDVRKVEAFVNALKHRKSS